MDTNHEDMLFQIQKRLEYLYPSMALYCSQPGQDDYASPIIQASRVVESIIVLIAHDQGFEYENKHFVNIKTGEAASPVFTSPFQFAHSGYLENIPPEIRRYLEILHHNRNIAAHKELKYSEAVVYADAFDCFIGWFIINSSTIQNLDDGRKQKFLETVQNLSHVMTLQIVSDGAETKDFEMFSAASQAASLASIISTTEVESNETSRINTQQCMNRILSLVQRDHGLLNQIKCGMIRIEKKIDLIADKLNEISKQISVCQSLLSRQIDMAVNEQEVDRILCAYADEITRKIVNEINNNTAQQEYDAEKMKLQLSVGENVWNKLNPVSQDFLVTAKVTYNKLITMRETIDYSGVCLLVTKAIELEMSTRFYREYLEYLREKYPGKAGYTLYPTALLDRYGKPIKANKFTLGSIAYILCYSQAEDISPNQVENNHEKLIEYVSTCLMKGKDKEEIENHLELIAEGVESIRKDYRNPSAHINQLQRINAQQCFELVIDVEKLLKQFLIVFDH